MFKDFGVCLRGIPLGRPGDGPETVPGCPGDVPGTSRGRPGTSQSAVCDLDALVGLRGALILFLYQRIQNSRGQVMFLSALLWCSLQSPASVLEKMPR